MEHLTASNKLIYGGDYNPEQWLAYPEILEKDITYFKQANINEVTIGVFSWSMLEPEEGKYDFTWMEEIINKMYENGISVILATPSGARPRWMAEKYEEVLRVDETRHRNLFGIRHNHCYTSPVFREKIRNMNLELSRRFGSHPGVIAWHISNEFSGECHCPLCQHAFQNWLKEKYGTIENLNHAWWTTFWSHTYRDFSEVESPSSRGDTILHGLNLDWKRFVTDQTKDYIHHEVQAIRDGGSDRPTLLNLMYDFMGLNYHKFADVVDIISWDSYPFWHREAESKTGMQHGMQHDIMRSIKMQPYLLMESSPSATNWEPVSKLKKPGVLKLASLQAIAHGSDSVQYFQLRKSRGSYEKFHGAVIDHDGRNDTRVFCEVAETGAILELLEPIAASVTKSDVAVIFDWENRWAMEDAAGPRNEGLHYKKVVEKSYSAFRKLGLNVDVIDMEQSLSGYRIVAAPMTYMFRAGFEKKAEQFVKNGGHLILTYWSGVVDDMDLCFLEGTPHGLMEVCGIRCKEIDALYDDETNAGVPVANGSVTFSKEYTCQNLCALIATDTAETLLTYKNDFYAGMSALTKNKYGAGISYYICADFEQRFYDDFYKNIVAGAGVKVPFEEIPPCVEVTTRENETERFMFIQNFKNKPVELPFSYDKNCTVLYSEGDLDMIPEYGTMILQMNK